MRFINGCLTVAAVLVGLVVATYLVVNVGGMVRAGWQQGRLADDVTERLVDEVPAARERQGGLVARVGIAPEHAWIDQSCERDSNDAGWFPQTYREVCELRAGAVWPVASREEALSLARVEVPRTSGIAECERLGETPEGMEAKLVTVAAGEQPWCVRDSVPTRRVIDGGRAELPRGTWLLVEEVTPLLDETIGCLHWSVIFCDDPWGDDHAFGDPPE